MSERYSILILVYSIKYLETQLYYIQVPLNTGALYPATNVISTYVYNMLMSAGTGSVGMASAAAFYQSIVGFILVMTTNFIVKKISPENALF